jgi:hypothetical protein
VLIVLVGVETQIRKPLTNQKLPSVELSKCSDLADVFCAQSLNLDAIFVFKTQWLNWKDSSSVRSLLYSLIAEKGTIWPLTTLFD